MDDLYCVVFTYMEELKYVDLHISSGENVAEARQLVVDNLRREYNLGMNDHILARVVYTHRDPKKANDFYEGFKKAMVEYGRSEVRSADTGRGRRDSSLRPVV